MLHFQGQERRPPQHLAWTTAAWPASSSTARICRARNYFSTWTTTARRATSTRRTSNAYLQEIAGQEFTAKDFRTWAGTVLAARALQEFEVFDSQTQAKRNVVEAIESVSQRLGNTKAVCRKCYVHPAVINAYLDGSLLDTLRQRVEKEITGALADLPPEEAAVLAFLQERLKREAQERTAPGR